MYKTLENTVLKYKDNYSEGIDLKTGKTRRNSLIKPLPSYLAKDWCHHAGQIFKDVYGRECPHYPQYYTIHSSYLKRKIFPLVFQEKQWSAQDFSDFLRIYHNLMKKNGYYFVMMVMKGYKFTQEVTKQDLQFHKRRLEDTFYRLSYCPHNTMFNDKNDIFEILDLVSDDSGKFDSGIIANYGIPIYHKYNQIRKDISFDDSKKNISDLLKKIIIENKHDQSGLKRYFYYMAYNSVYWGPYCESDMLKTGELESCFVLDWQKEFDKVWEFFGIKDTELWEMPINLKLSKIIPPVKYLFEVDIKRSRK